MSRLAAAAIASAGVMATCAAPAGAHGGLACELTGSTTYLTPPVQFVGGAGAFAFGASGFCVDDGVVSPANVAGNGTYTNIVCGTGTWAFVMQVYTYRGHTVDARATFTNGHGPVTGTHGSRSGAGTIHLRPSPDNQPSPPGNCATRWDFTMTYADHTSPAS